jgi:N-acetylglutamate synthase-like GNAT family acetyltransferase
MIIRSPKAQDFQKVREMLADANLPTEDFAPEHLVFIADDEGNPVGAIGFERYETIGLLRSLVVADSARVKGLGRELVEALEGRAREQGVAEIWLLTIDADAYFEKLGYVTRDRGDAPDAIRNTAEFAELCPDNATLMSKKLG